MYHAVKRWVTEEGGRLAYLGGNGINCEVEFLDQQTLTVRNGRRGGYDVWDPQAPTRFEARVESEAALLGVRHTWPGYETAAPYRVERADHWAFSGTGLRNGELFGQRNLNMRGDLRGASGHETDKVARVSPPTTTVLARGANADDGGAHMVHVAFDKGGEVFSAGSIAYVASLPVDDTVSKVTSNVLHRFLTQPSPQPNGGC